MNIDLSGKLALVTGASRGIGAAIADGLAAAGATVIGTATSEGGAEAIEARLKAVSSAEHRGVVLRLDDLEAAEASLKALITDAGTPAIVVNNAGITRDNLAMRMNLDDWDAVLNTNLKGSFSVIKSCLRGMMKARHGRIINIGSVVGSSGNPGQANYSASKAGVLGMTRSLAQELGSRGITVNAVAPGFIATDMTDALTDEQRDKMAADIPLARLGEPADIAHAVCFLASDSASYITGETLHVNGGMYMC
ncbi:MAG: 3-oxoacyl-ACP reductase FabG [Gammaproteobacteria bacterium]|nr:3-oxoacyl-ACP reductase FabG [Gammaproteobacteria bacterium]